MPVSSGTWARTCRHSCSGLDAWRTSPYGTCGRARAPEQTCGNARHATCSTQCARCIGTRCKMRVLLVRACCALRATRYMHVACRMLCPSHVACRTFVHAVLRTSHPSLQRASSVLHRRTPMHRRRTRGAPRDVLRVATCGRCRRAEGPSRRRGTRSARPCLRSAPRMRRAHTGRPCAPARYLRAPTAVLVKPAGAAVHVARSAAQTAASIRGRSWRYPRIKVELTRA
jgi:hypothetical protein